MHLLLFGADYQFFGEIRTQANGALERVVLTDSGQGQLGPIIAEWQHQGVPRQRSSADFSGPRVLPRSEEFQSAVEDWAVERDLVVISFDDPRYPLWERMCRLPFSPGDRLAFLLAIKHSPVAMLPEWRQQLLALEGAV